LTSLNFFKSMNVLVVNGLWVTQAGGSCSDRREQIRSGCQEKGLWIKQLRLDFVG